MKKTRTYLWLFGTNLYISAFTFGGGYVVIPMIRKTFVEKKKFFDEDELMDMAAVAQSCPGAISVNLTVLAGKKAGGPAGAVISGLAAVIPPIAVLSLISLVYAAFRDNQAISAVLKGMEAGVAALIVDLVIDMSGMIFGQKKLLHCLLLPAAFVASFFGGINVAVILSACTIITVLYSLGREMLEKRRVSDG